MKKLLLFALSATLFLSACKKEEDDPPDTSKAKVMFMHATLNVDTLRVKANSSFIINDLVPISASAYKDVDPGTANLAFVLPQTNLTMKDTVLTLTSNSRYSVFSTGTVLAPGIFVTNDDLTVPPAGNAKIRLINLAISNLNEKFFLGSITLDSNVSYREATPFRTVATGTYDVLLQDPTQPTAIEQIIGMQLASGKIYTIVLTGIIGGTGNADLKTTVINHN